MEDLVFHCHLSTEEVGRMTIREIGFWHRRAASYFKRIKPET